jgi:hypothetical protein
VPETLRSTPKRQMQEPSGKYSKFQIEGWINFDPTGKTVAEVVQGVEQGDGFLTVVEVVKLETDVAAIGDEDVRECFKNVLAAKRLLQNVHELPKKLIEDLRLALNTEEGVTTEKTVTPIAGLSVKAPSLSRFTLNQEAAVGGDASL